MIQTDIKLIDNKSGTLRKINLEDIENLLFEPIALITVDGKILFLNDEFYYSIKNDSDKEEIIGRNIKDIIDDIGDQIIEIYKQVIKSNTPVIKEFIFPSGNDKLFHNSKLIPVYVGEMNIPAILTIFLGTSDNDSAKLALRKSEQNYKHLIDSLVDSLLILFEGKIIFANKSLYRVSGYNEDEIMGNSFLLFFDNEEGRKVLEYYNERVKGQDAPSKYRSKAMSKDGRYHDIEIISNNVFFDGKDAIQVIIRDITDHVTMQNTIKEKEEKYRFLSNSTFEGILVHKKGIILDANDSFLRMNGYSMEEIEGKNLIDFITNKKGREEVIKNMHNNLVKPYVITNARKDGTEFIAQIQGKQVLHNGEVVRIASVRDVTEQVKLQKELENTNTYLKTLMSNLSGMVYRCFIDKDWTMVFISEGCKGLLGYSPDEIVFSKKYRYADIIYHEDRNMVWTYISETLKKDEFFEIEYRIVTKNGDIKWVWEKGRKINIEKREFIEGFVTDITTRKNAEKHIVNNEAKYKALFEGINDSVFVHPYIKNGYANFIEVNNIALNTYGYTREEFLKMSLVEINNPDDFVYFDIEKSKKQLLKDKFRVLEAQHVTKSGKVFTVEISSRIFEIDGKPLIMSMVRDITKRKNDERKLLFSENRLKTLSDGTFEAIFVSDKGICIDQNLTAEKMFGYAHNEAVGRVGLEWIVPEERDKVTELILKDNSKPFESIAFRKDGTRFPCQIQSRMAKIDNKDLRITALRDISDVKKAENRLIKSEERFRTYIQNTPFGIFITNSEGYFTEVNKAGERLTGYSRKELLKMRFTDLLQPEDIELVMSLFKILQTENVVASEEIWFKRKDGEMRTWHIDAVKIDDNQYLVTTYDITQQRQDEDKIFQLVHDQQIMLDNDPSFIIFKDTNDYILRITNTVATLTGLKKSQIEGKPSSVIYPKMYKEYYKDDLEVIRTGKPKTGIIEPLYSHDGKTTWLLTNKIPYKEKGDKVTGIIIFSTDITPLKDFEDELVKKNRELLAEKEKAEESDRLKSAFLANMSHEIRTPMNGILGFTNFLRSPDLSGDKKDEYIEIIQESGVRMLNTINDLIDISKIESGIEVVNLSEINLVEITEKLYKFFLPDAKRKGLSLEFKNMLNQNHLIVLTDQDKINSILTNLIKNAIKFTFAGFVEIKIDFYDSNAILIVSDSGIGIPANRQQAVFDRFVQADIADSKVFEGSGLGLSITSAYVEMLGGTIKLNSKEGEGTEFIVSIPVLSEKLIKNYTKTKEMESNSSRDKSMVNILIAEDDEISFELLKIALGRDFGKIYHAQNGKEAVSIFKNNDDIGLIIMDVKMPIMGGLEATSEIRKFNKDIKIIAQTAYALSGDENRVLESGCDDYISKPIDIDELRKKIYANL